MNATPEEWRELPGYEGRYEVSNYGRVRSWVARGLPHPYTMRLWQAPNGRLSVHVAHGGKKRTRLVHQLVLEAFEGPRPDWANLVRHLDGNALNNFVGNLAYGTDSENQKDAVRHGTHYCHGAQKTHCKRGHEFTPENIYVRPGRKERNCRECRRLAALEQSERRRQRTREAKRAEQKALREQQE